MRTSGQVCSAVTDKAKQVLEDNLKWLDIAEKERLSVGAPARVLWADLESRIKIAKAINGAVASRKLKVAASDCIIPTSSLVRLETSADRVARQRCLVWRA